ncbi:MAG: ornithine cyclodeaminase family protein [Woeseiaceae bacterium]|jgi:ornithine cyclodeaminase|nr:ornithine cyclodeaminase family protein [Woeseiaceae bacterium]
MTPPIPIIDADTIRRYTPMPDLVEALRSAFRTDIEAPPRTAHALGEHVSLLLMPAWEPGGRVGVKLTHVDTERAPSVAATYALLDGASGQPLALLDGAMLTARRTAAASALAADYLARRDAATLLVLATGVLAPHLVEAHAAVRPLKKVLVWGRNPDKAQAVANRVLATGLHADVVNDPRDAAGSADIITSATSTHTPVLFGGDVGAGTHVDLVGSFRPDMREADAALFERGRVYVDTFAGALEEAGDLIHALDTGALLRDDIAGDLAGLCRGTTAGRASDDELTVFKSVGTALEDLAGASLVYDRYAAGRSSR